MKRRLWGVPAALCIVFVSACGGGEGSTASDDADSTTTAPTPTTSATSPPTTTPPTTPPPTTPPPATSPPTTSPPTTIAVEAEPVILPWAATDVEGCICSDGSPLTIFERPADPNKVVLFFEGGGACFNLATCDPNGSPTYTVARKGLGPPGLAQLEGIFDNNNPENPLADHSIVYVPYCTGDVHTGAATTDYGDGVVVEHRGHANALKAIDYVAENFPDATQVVVTGESAGSVPTPVAGALVADLLPDASIVTLGDSSGAYPDLDGGLIAEAWGTADAIPPWPELEGITAADWSFPEQYIHAGVHAPDVRFGRFDFAFDEVQALYSALAGIPPDQMVSLIDANEAQIEAGGVAVASYVAAGRDHTVLAQNQVYRVKVGDVRLIDWLTALINDPEPPADVHCETCEG